jgi:transcriptional regulator with XRE-family HTH domain
MTAHLARRLRLARERSRMRQTEIAQRATALGLDWSPATVTALESGRRALGVGEFLLAPAIFGGSLAQFLCDDGEVIEIVPGRTIVCQDLRQFLKPNVSVDVRLHNTDSAEPPDPRRMVLEAERKAARRLGVTTDQLLDAANRLWAHNLSSERDLQAINELGSIDAHDARAVQALRGRITRRLLDELRQELAKRPIADGDES